MFRLLKNLNRKDWLLALCCLILVVSQVYFELRMPDYMSQITRLVQTEGSAMKDILINGLYMVGCALASFVLMGTAGYFSATVSSNFSMRTRKKLFDKVERLDMAEVKQFSTSSLITRTTNDITQIQMVVAMGLQLMIKAPVTAVWAVFKILGKGWQWSVATAIAVVILLCVIGILSAVVVPKFKIVQKLIDRLNGQTRENLTGIRVVREFNEEDYQENKFNNTNVKLTKQQIFNQKMFSIMQPTMNMVMHSLTLAIYVIGAILISQSIFADKLTIFSNMVVFSSYSIHVIMSFLMLAMILMMLPRAAVSADRINEVLNTKITIKDGNKDEGIEKGTVEFKNVSFKYPDADEYLLENISFKANKGDIVAFIGSTGSGKSTLINLIPRFYDATDGEVLVDGINVKDYKLEALYNKLGYIPQKAVMFNGTVTSNVSYGENGKGQKDENLIKEAIRVAQATEFVEKIDEGYNTHIAQGGTNVSGGQKQRLAIARAIARQPEIYIFDDSFSALDNKTEKFIINNIRNLLKGKTCIIISNRISDVKNADKIIVLDKGKIIQSGIHNDLLKVDGLYRDFYNQQSSSIETI